MFAWRKTFARMPCQVTAAMFSAVTNTSTTTTITTCTNQITLSFQKRCISHNEVGEQTHNKDKHVCEDACEQQQLKYREHDYQEELTKNEYHNEERVVNVNDEEDVITPWNVVAKTPKGINYDRVLSTFRASKVDETVLNELVETMNVVHNKEIHDSDSFTHKKLHHFFRRGVVLSHRDFDKALHDIATFHNRKHKLSSQNNCTTHAIHSTNIESVSNNNNNNNKISSQSESLSSSLEVHNNKKEEQEKSQEQMESTRNSISTNDNNNNNKSKYQNNNRALASTVPQVYLYTGRGPSATSMHLGHAIPFILAKYLQETLALPLVIQITDDEKYLFRDIALGDSKIEELICNNIKDIIAFGFQLDRTFIFRNSEYMGAMYPTVLKLQKAMTLSSVKNTLGLNDSDNIGKCAFPATQAAPCFASTFMSNILSNATYETVLPTKKSISHNMNECKRCGGSNNNTNNTESNVTWRCLIPCAIDQDPFFVLTRNVASRFRKEHYFASSLLHTKFLPALKGLHHKMSSSDIDQGVITLHDSDNQVHKKLRKAFSGGSGTLLEMQSNGANLEVDVAYQLITFLCPDDELWSSVTQQYASGEMHSGCVKEIAANVIIEHVLQPWRARREAVTDDDVKSFMRIRSITH